MGNCRSKNADNSSAERKTTQTSNCFTNLLQRQQIDISITKNILLILSDNINDITNGYWDNALINLYRLVNSDHVFFNGDNCAEFLLDKKDDQVRIIIAGSLEKNVIENVIPLIHNMNNVKSILIFCFNGNIIKEWVKEWPKIMQVFTDIETIYHVLLQESYDWEDSALPISLISAREAETAEKNFDRIDCIFMYVQILNEMLLSIEFTRDHINQFIDFCQTAFRGDENKLKTVRDIEKNYDSTRPIWYYTSASFLHRMLNQSLRMMDVDIILNMGFFIHDLHRQIEQLHRKQFPKGQPLPKFTVYRGQRLFKIVFDRLTQTRGGLLSFNNFLSTSKSRDTAITFAGDGIVNSNMVDVLFLMEVDPSQSPIPFASVQGNGCFDDSEDEVLFSMNTVFRINDIKWNENERFWEVKLTLTSDHDPELCSLTQRLREENFPHSKGWYRLGLFLLKIDRPREALKVYEMMLKQATDDHEKANIYHQLGWVKDTQGEYAKALHFCERSNELYQRLLPPLHPTFADLHNTIGTVYHNQRNYSEALRHYERALEIKTKCVSTDQSDLTKFYNNIGTVYCEMSQYSKAIVFLEKTLEIRQSLTTFHPDLANTFNSIGAVYEKMREYSKAYSFYKRAVDIAERSLPIDHLHVRWYQINLTRVRGALLPKKE